MDDALSLCGGIDGTRADFYDYHNLYAKTLYAAERREEAQSMSELPPLRGLEEMIRTFFMLILLSLCQDAVAMVDLMLDDLGGEAAAVRFMPDKVRGLPADADQCIIAVADGPRYLLMLNADINAAKRKESG